MPNHEAQKINLSRASLGSPPAQMKQFEFLMGNWNVAIKNYQPDGTVESEEKGTWSAECRNGGRMVFDEFTRISSSGEETSYAITLRTFCPETDQWEMTFLFSLQQDHPQFFRGKFVEGEGRFEAVIDLTSERSIPTKIRFFDIRDDRFEWTMKHSVDDGKTWFLGEHISATRASLRQPL